ncbi:hypothetical protein M413DRAFT_25400 [Hebeloma cylindrosporum]|uniref:Uncharacterized protein n=1 Tax=Hebeloma cylindrosporum TaxID=76867 RepID=A0A0C3C842_HEBCY|nr:hypothetical protein M413DRAFT_25400 [Hebeloma cylindrosporum h7]
MLNRHVTSLSATTIHPPPRLPNDDANDPAVDTQSEAPRVVSGPGQPHPRTLTTTPDPPPQVRDDDDNRDDDDDNSTTTTARRRRRRQRRHDDDGTGTTTTAAAATTRRRRHRDDDEDDDECDTTTTTNATRRRHEGDTTTKATRRRRRHDDDTKATRRRHNDDDTTTMRRGREWVSTTKEPQKPRTRHVEHPAASPPTRPGCHEDGEDGMTPSTTTTAATTTAATTTATTSGHDDGDKPGRHLDLRTPPKSCKRDQTPTMRTGAGAQTASTSTRILKPTPSTPALSAVDGLVACEFTGKLHYQVPGLRKFGSHSAPLDHLDNNSHDLPTHYFITSPNMTTIPDISQDSPKI